MGILYPILYLALVPLTTIKCTEFMNEAGLSGRLCIELILPYGIYILQKLIVIHTQIHKRTIVE